ncbi:MAG TPA: DUF4255 domain-containing protein [Bryobacteraceae bacterium]
MSNALGVASVSFVLVDLLNNGLIDRDISASVGDISVTALAPDQVEAAQGKSQLNLFLYNVTQNEAWRNMNFPSLNAQGERINNPPLALNLHYLLTAYGIEQYHAEILLGYGMQLFHENPVLMRDAIRESLAAPTQVAGGNLPASMLNLFTSGLADQIEQIKIWPQMLTTEEISRLWTAFQAKYRPTAAYQVSVVLIESERSTKKALPVQTRTIKAVPFEKPIISRVLAQADLTKPALDQPIFDGYILALQGQALKGETTTVLFGDIEVAPIAVTASQVTVALPSGLLPGTQSVAVNQPMLLGSPPEPHRGTQSAPVPFTLQPRIQTITPSSGQIDITLDLAVGPSQTALLVLNQLLPLTSPPASNANAYTFPATPRISLASPPLSPPPPSPNLSFPIPGVDPGTYLVRVQVADAESPLTPGPDGRLVNPQVTIL